MTKASAGVAGQQRGSTTQFADGPKAVRGLFANDALWALCSGMFEAPLDRSKPLPPIEGFPDLDAAARLAIEDEFESEHAQWLHHYTGNCTGCSRCSDAPTRQRIAQVAASRLRASEKP